MRVLPIVFLCLAVACSAFAQSNSEKFRDMTINDGVLDKTDIQSEFVKYDIAPLLTRTANSKVVGFIGDDYQRIRVKVISVIRNPGNPREYFVYGKTMVMNNVCDFQGMLSITSVYVNKGEQVAGAKRGKAVGEYLFFENPQQKHVGQFHGVFVTNWLIDKDGVLRYDETESVSDDFSNNQFVGTWTDYSGKITNPCHWGDHRIPMSGDLDDGAAEFHPAPKYHKKGWLSFVQAQGKEGSATTEAKKVEEWEWWK